MDIERLNKFQIVLLTLLISFVTSIATGIVTVSLMEQAPPVIPQTINRVVERTVERVVPHETQTATVITTEKTVVVKESDLVAQAVARVRPSVVRVYGTTAKGEIGDFLARGLIVANGYIVVPLAGADAVKDKTYMIVIGDSAATSTVLKTDAAYGITLLAFTEPKSEAAVLGTGTVTLGQTVIAIGGSEKLTVATGIVTTVNEANKSQMESFETDISIDAFIAGSPLLNTDGAAIGMFAGSAQIIPTSALTDLVKSLESKVDKATTTKSI